MNKVAGVGLKQLSVYLEEKLASENIEELLEVMDVERRAMLTSSSTETGQADVPAASFTNVSFPTKRIGEPVWLSPARTTSRCCAGAEVPAAEI
jgi:hypothetical protein